MSSSKKVRRNRRQAGQGPLWALRQRYLTLRTMADHLRRFDGFADVSHVTLSRWLKTEERNRPLPHRAQAAIQRLAVPPLERLRIPFHDSPSALPVMMLTVQAEGQRAVEVEKVPVSSGLEALKKVSDGAADIAIAYRHASPHAGAKSERLCGFVAYHLEGFYIEKDGWSIRSHADLQKVKFGFPAASAVGEFLDVNVPLDRGCAPRAFGSADEARQELIKGKVNCLIGWRPWITKAREQLAGHLINDLPIGLLPRINLDLFVSRKTQKGPSILRFLRELNTVIMNVESALTRLDSTQVESLAKRIGVSDLSELHEMIRTYEFRLSDPSLDVLFAIMRESEIATSSIQSYEN